jgi:nucleoside-diphosphate-sugar epimerase
VRVVAHVRPDSPRLEEYRSRFARDGAEFDATPWDETEMAATLGRVGPSLVFGLLGTTRARGREASSRGAPVETYETIDYGLTVLLLRATVRAAPQARFVYLSAIGAERPSSNAYSSARHKVEAELRSSGLSCVIARPSFITGPDREEKRPGERAAAAVADALLGVAKGLGAQKLHDRFASITADGLARSLVELALSESSGVRVAEAAELQALASA